MKTVLICPDRRPEVAFLTRKNPLALTPILGPSLLSHWFTSLADRGVKEVTVLASDRPDQVRAAVGTGERWGIRIEILAEARELSESEARSRFQTEHVIIADRLPHLTETPLFDSLSGFFNALLLWLPEAHDHGVGIREITPGIWVGMRSKIDPEAKMQPPCWLGANVWVRAGATVGPNTIVEDSAIVDHDAEATGSWIGPWTYAGAFTHLNNSLAWSDGLTNLGTGSFTEIVDAFLLSDLHGGSGFERQSPWYGRLAALIALLVTSPVLLAAALRRRPPGKPLFSSKRATIPSAVMENASLREMDYRELNGVNGLWRRWPQLWNIVRGDFSWVGNRPITRSQASSLETEFEQLWLSAPIGFVSLADAFGCGDDFEDESRAHSSFYAVHADTRINRAVLRWLLFGTFPLGRKMLDSTPNYENQPS